MRNKNGSNRVIPIAEVDSTVAAERRRNETGPRTPEQRHELVLDAKGSIPTCVETAPAKGLTAREVGEPEAARFSTTANMDRYRMLAYVSSKDLRVHRIVEAVGDPGWLRRHRVDVVERAPIG